MSCAFWCMPRESSDAFFCIASPRPISRRSPAARAWASRWDIPRSAPKYVSVSMMRHVPVEPAVLGQVADARLLPDAGRPAEHGDRAAVGADDVEDHPHRRRLARAVRAEEPEDLAGPDVEREVGDDVDLAVALPDAAHVDAHVGRRDRHGGSASIREG